MGTFRMRSARASIKACMFSSCCSPIHVGHAFVIIFVSLVLNLPPHVIPSGHVQGTARLAVHTNFCARLGDTGDSSFAHSGLGLGLGLGRGLSF